MNRRNFLTRVAKGAAAAVVLAHVPISWAPAGQFRHYWALAYIDAEHKKFMRGKSIHEHPELILVGRDLYEAAEGEMIVNYRFTTTDQEYRDRSLMFRASILSYEGRGWRVNYIGPRKRTT